MNNRFVKIGEAAKLLTEADQFFASSPTYSNCGHKKTDLTLSERRYHCTECDFECNRDLNAAINLCPAQP